MPICQYFLKGKCNRDDCPYSHVNVGRQAVVCEDFLKGYCALGFKVKDNICSFGVKLLGKTELMCKPFFNL